MPSVLGLDGTTVLVAIIGAPSALLISIAAVVSAVGTVRNGRVAKVAAAGVGQVQAELQANGGSSHQDKIFAKLDYLAQILNHHADEIADVKLAIGDVAGHVADLTLETMNNKRRLLEAEAAEVSPDRRQRGRHAPATGNGS